MKEKCPFFFLRDEFTFGTYFSLLEILAKTGILVALTRFPRACTLTSNIYGRRLTLDLSRSGPSDALALELVLAKVLLDMIPRDVELAVDDPRSRVGIHKVLLLRLLRSHIVATEVDL